MVMLARPNFFLLLDLQPDSSWDQALFEKRLREKRIEWSRQSGGVARKALVARQNLALISKIQEVMANPELRTQEATAARLEISATSQAAYAQFETQLALMNAKDAIEQEELERFIHAFEHLCPAADIRARLQVKVMASGVVAAPPVLEAAVARAIADRLDFLRMHTLYTLLQLPALTSTAALSRAADHFYTRMVALQPTVEVVAKMELAGLASEVFKSDEMRACYDASLRLASLSHLLTELEEHVNRSTDQTIHPRQVLLFLEQARKVGWDVQEALAPLKEYARQHTWIIMLPALPPQTETLLCPNCQQLNQANQHYCTTCQQELHTECPACGQVTSCEHMACGQCGFPIGNRYLVDKLLEEVQDLLRQGEGVEASEVLNQAERAWPSLSKDARTQWIMAHRAATERLLDAQKQARIDAVERLAKLTIHEIQAQQIVRISWDLPSNGTVIMLQSAQPLQLEGKALPASQVESLGQRLESNGNFAIDRWRAGASVYYTPLLLLHQWAYAGPSQRYVCVANVRNLTYQYPGSVLRLRWDWPQDCQEVLLSSHTGVWPGEHAPPATTTRVSRATYEKQGYYDLGISLHCDHYIAISSLMQLGEEEFLAEGLRVHARLASKVTLTYEIKNAARGKRSLHLFTEPHTALPVMLLVSKPGGLPLRKTDGKVVQRIKATSGEKGRLIIDLSALRLEPHTLGKLFFEHDISYGEFTIHHPAEHQMRLS